MPIDQLPSFPSRKDTLNFAARAEAALAALPTFINQVNALELANLIQGAEATAARDAAIAAWAASTAPTEQLSAISQSLHSGSVVKTIVYDTSKDSDGGAWRKRCQHTSWYQEALGFTGKWLGQRVSTVAAWAVSGAAAGDGFQNSTDGKFYTLTGTSTASEIFRGNVREFPAVVAVVAESSRVVIYDLTQPTCPMWMVFKAGAGSTLYTGNVSSVAAVNGYFVFGSSSHLGELSFVADTSRLRNASGTGYNLQNVAARNTTSGPTPYGTLAAIVNANVNDVAITVLEGAPTDPATGLSVPTIAVATAAGVSVIKDDGSIVNSSHTTSCSRVSIVDTTLWTNFVTSVSSNLGYKDLVGIAVSWSFTFLTTPYTRIYLDNSTAIAPRSNAGGSNAGAILLKHNPSTPAKGMVANITNTYNTGWMVGDIRGALLADTSAETLSASGELMTNGTFPTDTSGWISGNAATLSVVSGAMRIATGTSYGYASFPVSCIVGKTYRFQLDTVGGSAGARTLQYATTSAITTVGPSIAATATGSVDFVATSTTMWVGIVVNGTSVYQDIDNVSVKLVDPDRCAKAKGMVVNGSLTKTAVAAGAGLVAYSGFGTVNYLEQPYSPDLDFGTGDTGRQLWVKFAATSAKEVIWCRDSATTGVLSRLQVDATTSYLSFTMFDGTTTRTATGTAAIDDGLWHLVETRYSAGTLTILVDGNTYATATGAALLTMNNATAVFRLGVDCQGANPASSGSFALLRTSATVASNDQSAHIYRTELPLFQANAQCTLAGTSTAVTTLTYDDDTALLHVGTSWGRSSLKDLTRIESEATTTGALTSLSASGGFILTGGSSGKVYMPALLLREELRRKAEARRALGKVPVFFDQDAVTGQTAFAVPKGYTVKAVYSASALKRSGSTKDYTVSNDGFAEAVNFAVAPGNGVWVSLMCVRA